MIVTKEFFQNKNKKGCCFKNEEKTIIRRVLTVIALGLLLSVTIIAPKTGVGAAYTPDMSNGADNFYKSNKVTMKRLSLKTNTT